MKTSTKISFIELFDNENNCIVLNPRKQASLDNITPIPKKTELGLPFNSHEENSTSNLTQIIPFECTCGRDLGVYTRAISILSLKELSSTESFENICKNFDLNGCCRMKIIAPIIAPVISLDINAYVVEDYEVLEKGYKWPSYKIPM